MAAYAALSSLSEATELLLRKISILQETNDDDDGVHRTPSRNLLLRQLQDKIESLGENTDFLRSVLEKSPAHPFEAQMKGAADRAQVIIQQFVLGQLGSESTVDDALIFQSPSHQLQMVHDGLISSMVEKIHDNAEVSGDQEEPIGIFDSSSERGKIPLNFNNEVIVAVGGAFDELYDHVFNGHSVKKLRVVSILGMGGIGKTTLARMFYNNTRNSEQFKVVGWVTVSQDFSTRDILVSLMSSIKPYITHPKQRNESIENHIRKNLEGRRFLVVLDDVWSPEALRLLMRTFPDNDNGSRMLVTTREDEVAAQANQNGEMHSVKMRFMDLDASCDLLLHKVFTDVEDCRPELRYLSNSIAMECEGLPLAIVLVAGILLASDRSLREWNYVFEKLTADSTSRVEKVGSILSLSYKHLPHRLRSCLLYMGAYPEDHEINLSLLTKQLTAQDFLHRSEIHEAEQYLQDLVYRNLMSVLKMKSDGRIKSVCLHDMVRDFLVEKAREEEFLCHVTKDNDYHTGSKIKVTFDLDSLKRICNSDDADYDTHTVICFGRSRSPLTSIGRFRLLKSLDLPNFEVESFPNEVLDLFLLRLLVLGYVPELPESISNLRYLETLIVNTAKDASSSSSSSSTATLPRILCLPSEIWAVSGLRHVVSFCCGPLPNREEENCSPLENLETLSAVMNLDCSEDVIRMIPNVKKLGVFYFGVERATHSIENVERLRLLEKLKVWVMVPFSAPQNLNLGFPTTLRKLTLRGIRLSHRDMDIIGRLPRLQVLKLRRVDFEGGEWRITTQQQQGFEVLEYLLLEELGLRHWSAGNDDGHCSTVLMPMLKTLEIRTCNGLSEIETVFRDAPLLELVQVVGCKNKSLVASAKRMEEVKFPYLIVRVTNYI